MFTTHPLIHSECKSPIETSDLQEAFAKALLPEATLSEKIDKIVSSLVEIKEEKPPAFINFRDKQKVEACLGIASSKRIKKIKIILREENFPVTQTQVKQELDILKAELGPDKKYYFSQFLHDLIYYISHNTKNECLLHNLTKEILSQPDFFVGNPEDYRIFKDPKTGYSTLHSLIRTRHIQSVVAFLTNAETFIGGKQKPAFGDILKCITKNNFTLLHIACLAGSFELVDLILQTTQEALSPEDFKNFLNSKTKHGDNALYVVCGKAKKILAQENPSDAESDRVESNRYREIANWLNQYGIDANADTSIPSQWLSARKYTSSSSPSVSSSSSSSTRTRVTSSTTTSVIPYSAFESSHRRKSEESPSQNKRARLT